MVLQCFISLLKEYQFYILVLIQSNLVTEKGNKPVENQGILNVDGTLRMKMLFIVLICNYLKSYWFSKTSKSVVFFESFKHLQSVSASQREFVLANAPPACVLELSALMSGRVGMSASAASPVVLLLCLCSRPHSARPAWHKAWELPLRGITGCKMMDE